MGEAGAGRRQPVTVGETRPPATISAPAKAWSRGRESRVRNGKQAAARQAALTRLQRSHPDEYAELYQVELAKLGVADHRPIGRPAGSRSVASADVPVRRSGR